MRQDAELRRPISGPQAQRGRLLDVHEEPHRPCDVKAVVDGRTLLTILVYSSPLASYAQHDVVIGYFDRRYGSQRRTEASA